MLRDKKLASGKKPAAQATWNREGGGPGGKGSTVPRPQAGFSLRNPYPSLHCPLPPLAGLPPSLFPHYSPSTHCLG